MTMTKGKATGYGIHSPLVYDFCTSILQNAKSIKKEQFADYIKLKTAKTATFHNYIVEHIQEKNEVQQLLLAIEYSILDNERDYLFFTNIFSYQEIDEVIQLNYPFYTIRLGKWHFFLISNNILHKKMFIIQ